MTTQIEIDVPVKTATKESNRMKNSTSNSMREGLPLINNKDITLENDQGAALVTGASEIAILGATRQAVEGLIVRGALNNVQLIKMSTIDKGKQREDHVADVHETKVQNFYEKLQEVLARIYASEVTNGILGATTTADEVLNSTLSKVNSAQEETLNENSEIHSQSTGNIYQIQKRPSMGQLKVTEKKGLASTQINTWKPKNCQLIYTTPYPMPYVAPRKSEKITLKQTEISEGHKFKVTKESWCGCCMREAMEPYILPCGHSFCKRCIANTSYFLRQDHFEAVKDIRAVMRCPLRHCKAVIPCLPLINGDFRFSLIRPEDKVPPKAQELNLCEQHRLTTYKIRIDVDTTRRKSDNLFEGFNDVIHMK